MFRSILVPVDDSPEAHRATLVAASLATATGMPIRLLTIAQPPADPVAVEADLHRRASLLFPASCTATVIVDDELESALVAAVLQRPDALVVLGSRARGPVEEFLLGSVSEAVLARAGRPVLLVGPSYDPGLSTCPTTVVAGVDSRRAAELMAPVLEDWASRFASRTWLVQVAPPDGSGTGDALETGLVHRAAAAYGPPGAEWDVIHDRSAADGLLRFATDLGGNGAVPAVATRRWSDPARIHWGSTARRLVRRSPWPVLVVPEPASVGEDRPGAEAGAATTTG